MKEQKNTHKKGSWGVWSVYAALGVCLVAVAAATWTTFQSISSTLNGSTPDTAVSEAAEQAGETVSGVAEESSAAAEASDSEGQADAERAPAEEEEAVNATPESLSYPLDNGIVKPFGGETLVYSETLKDWRAHNGTDFQAETGETVLAAADGTVASVCKDGLWGNVVVVESGALEIAYCGLEDAIPVSEGDQVTAGQAIGTVGEIPAELSEQTHLHLEVTSDGEYLDFEALLTPAD